MRLLHFNSQKLLKNESVGENNKKRKIISLFTAYNDFRNVKIIFHQRRGTLQQHITAAALARPSQTFSTAGQTNAWHTRARARGTKDIRTMRARGKKENLNIDLCGAGLTSAQFVGSVELVDIPHIHMWHSRRARSTFLICPCYSISSQPIFPSIAPKRCMSVYVCMCVCSIYTRSKPSARWNTRRRRRNARASATTWEFWKFSARLSPRNTFREYMRTTSLALYWLIFLYFGNGWRGKIFAARV